MILKVALLQMLPAGRDVAANMVKGEAACRMARVRGADIALFPEMWSTGYAPCPSAVQERERWLSLAQAADGPFVQHFRGLAEELQMAVAITYLEATTAGPRNSVSLLSRSGDVLFTYAKVHTCQWDWEAALVPGGDFHVAALPTAAGSVQVGAMICYDRQFPESARVLMLMGAELVLTPNACPLELHRLAQFRTRAFENMIAVAMTNYPAPQCNGHSVAFSPVAFGRDPERPPDNQVVQASRAEGIWMAEFDLDQIRAYREREAEGNSYRKPAAYGAITSCQVRPPFIRGCAKR